MSNNIKVKRNFYRGLQIGGGGKEWLIFRREGFPFPLELDNYFESEEACKKAIDDYCDSTGKKGQDAFGNSEAQPNWECSFLGYRLERDRGSMLWSVRKPDNGMPERPEELSGKWTDLELAKEAIRRYATRDYHKD